MSGQELGNLIAGVRKGVQATLSTDEATRKKAEAQFQALGQSQYPKLVWALCNIVKDNSVPLDDASRQQSSVLLQQFVRPRDPRKRKMFAQLWVQQLPKFHANVKGSLRHAMCFAGQAGSALSRSAAACLAEIAVLEVPKGMWKSFSNDMKAMCCVAVPEADESTVALRKNAVSLVGQVCDRLNPSHFSQDDVNSLLASVVACMASRSPDVIATAMSALEKSLKFIEVNLGIKAHRDHLMGQLVTNGIKSTHPLVQKNALECLGSLCDKYYRYMPEYIQQIMNLTVNIVKLDSTSEEAKMQAIEVWNSILDVESELEEGNHRFMQRLGLELVPVLMKAMIFRNQRSAMLDDVAVEHYARTGLMLMATVLKSEKFLQTVMGIVGKCVAPQNGWSSREMGFVAMGVAMEVGSDPALAPRLKQYATECVKSIAIATKPESNDVLATKDSAIWALDRIFVFALDQLQNPNFAKTALKHVLTLCQTPGQPTQLVMRAVSCVKSYFKFFSYAAKEQQKALLHQFAPPPVFNHMLKAMVTLAEARSANLAEEHLGINIFDCIRVMMETPRLAHTDDPQTIEQNKPYYVGMLHMLKHMTSRLRTVVSNNRMSDQIRMIYIAGYCSALAGCLLSFETEAYRGAIVSTAQDTTKEILACCFEVQKMKGTGAGSVQEEALMLTTRIVSILGQGSIPFLPQILQNMKAVIDSKAGDVETKVAIGLISEAYTFGWNTSESANDGIMKLLLNMVADKTLSRSLKPLIIEAMCCMMNALGDKFNRYLKPIMSTIFGAMRVQKPDSAVTEEEQDTCSFVDTLRSEILLFLSTMLQVESAQMFYGHPEFQRNLGTFLVLCANPAQATEEQLGYVANIVEDLRNLPPTLRLAQHLMSNPAVKSAFDNARQAGLLM